MVKLWGPKSPQRLDIGLIRHEEVIQGMVRPVIKQIRDRIGQRNAMIFKCHSYTQTTVLHNGFHNTNTTISPRLRKMIIITFSRLDHNAVQHYFQDCQIYI